MTGLDNNEVPFWTLNYVKKISTEHFMYESSAVVGSSLDMPYLALLAYLSCTVAWWWCKGPRGEREPERTAPAGTPRLRVVKSVIAC